jgi:hypothetical protein
MIAPKPLSHHTWYARLRFWKQKRTYGQALEPGLPKRLP